jgi:cystathionine beta-lyase family protein involved in aluminum resistance
MLAVVMAKTGGYIVGRKDLIERISYRFTVPGLGGAEGATFGSLRDMFQGFFISPQTTGNAIKGAIFEAALLEEFGLSVSPKWDAPRTDLIQTVNFGNPDDMIKFAAAIQANSPIDSFVTPIPETMAGMKIPSSWQVGHLCLAPPLNSLGMAHCVRLTPCTCKAG